MLTVLSFGGGQDSTAILYKLIYDKSFYERYVSGDLLVLMSDTGDEHPQTYKHLSEIESLCNRNGIDFCLIKPVLGHHPRGWQSLAQQYSEKSSVGSKAFMKTCTDNLKIKPIYSYIGSYIRDIYELGPKNRKQEFYKYTERFGKLRMLIGIATGEEGRMISSDDKRPLWMQRCVNIEYPLIEVGMARADCQRYIKSVGHTVPLPSSCMMCPYMSEQELLWMHRNLPDKLDRWQQFEDAKLAKYEDLGDKNVGVWGRYDKKLGRPVRLADVLAVAESKYGHLSAAELHEHKMSHGHCIKTKY